MKNGTKFLIGLCAVFSLIAKAQFFPIPADVVPYGDNQRSLKGSSVDFRFSDSTKQLLVGLTASASRPAYSFPGTGNNDNGIWRSGTDEISLVTAGQNRLTIGPTGAISFGTSATPFVVRTGDTMTGALTVLSGVTAQVFRGPLIGGVTGNVTGNVVGNVTGSSSLNVLKAGDTMSGNLVINSGSLTNLALEGATGSTRFIDYRSVVAGASNRRWTVMTNGADESGSNAGSNYAINRYDDAGNFSNTSLLIARNGSGFVIGDPIQAVGGTMAGNLTLNGAGNALNLKIYTTNNVLNDKSSITFGTIPGGRDKARISMVNQTTGNAKGDLIFETNDGSALAEILRLDGDGVITQAKGSAPWVRKVGDTMTGLLGVGTLAYIGSTSGEIKFRAPATAGSQSYQWPSAQPSTSNSYLVGITTGAMVWEPIPQSEIFLQGTTSYGSTATKVRRWITTVTNTGSAVTLTQSATNGDTLTVNESGSYAISYCDNFYAASNMGISINASGTTSVQSLPPSQVACGNVSASINIGACCSAIIAVSSGSVVRAHTDGTLNGSNLWMQSIRIRKIGP